MADPYRSHYANGEAVDAALDSGVAAQSEVAGARGSYGNLNARLSAMDTSISNKANSSSVYTKTQVDNALNDKVSKVTGKGLSTNDFTTIEKTKLAGLQNYDDSALSGRVTTVEQSIATLNGSASASGSIANSVASGVQTSKDYTDTEIRKLDFSSVGGNGKYIKSVSQTDGKITAVEETMDTTPTASSTKAITSGAVHAAMTTETTAREAADAKHDVLLADLIDSGAKNLLNVFDASSGQTATIAGVTWTVNADGTVTANGTATANSFFYVLPNGTNVVLSQGATMMTGCPSGGSETTYEMQTVAVGGAVHHDYGSGVEQVGGYSYRYVALTVRNGYTADNLVFEPMICLKAAHDLTPKFVPYTPTLSELYAMIRNGSAVSANSLRQTAQLTATPNDTETEGETR